MLWIQIAFLNVQVSDTEYAKNVKCSLFNCFSSPYILPNQSDTHITKLRLVWFLFFYMKQSWVSHNERKIHIVRQEKKNLRRIFFLCPLDHLTSLYYTLCIYIMHEQNLPHWQEYLLNHKLQILASTRELLKR